MTAESTSRASWVRRVDDNSGRATGSDRRRPRPVVLLVDDYPDCRDMYGTGLRFAGFEVVTARDGFEALDVARRAQPDLILMDLGLPGLDGCEATRRLKLDPATSDVPVVALTAQALAPARSLAALGFESVIAKPCLPDQLADHVAGVLGRRDRTDAVA